MGDLTTLANVKQWLGITGLAVTSISNANPAVVVLASAPGIPLVNGATYTIAGSIGMVGVNGDWPISLTDPKTFSIPFDSTLAGTYTGGATIGVSDSLLTRLIHAASAYMETLMSRTIAQTTYSETRNGMGGQRMVTKNAPVVSVSALSINGVAIGVRPPLGPGVTTNPGGYVNDETSIMVSGYEFCRGFQNIVLHYIAGYATTPADIEQACIDMIGEWFRYMSRIGKLSEGIEGQTITFTNAQIPARALGVILAHKVVTPVY